MTTISGASVLLVGATGGLGAPVARALAAAGARLTLAGRDAATLDALGVEGAATVTADLLDPAGPAAMVAAAVEAHDGLDVVVLAAGVVAFGPADEVDDATWEQLVGTTLTGPARLLREASPHLRSSAERRGEPAVVVHVSAVVAEKPAAGMAAYSAVKAALTAFDAAAARELRRGGIHLVDVRPPHTETGLATRPIAGAAPKLPQGLEPDAVAARIVMAIEDDERDVPSTAFTA